MSLDQLYLSRPTHLNPSYSTPVEGLYLCGSGAHPGNVEDLHINVCTLEEQGGSQIAWYYASLVGKSLESDACNLMRPIWERERGPAI